MSTPKPPAPAKLVINLFLKKREIFKEVAEELREAFGGPDVVSPWFDFDFTDYYEKEMGRPLFARAAAFKSLMGQDSLADVKLATNCIETRFSRDGKRRVNIDPGYLLCERFVLATGKNFTHRIYVGKGIYGDLALIFQKKEFQTLPWTYPNYADKGFLGFLHRVRDKYVLDMKSCKNEKGK